MILHHGYTLLLLKTWPRMTGDPCGHVVIFMRRKPHWDPLAVIRKRPQWRGGQWYVGTFWQQYDYMYFLKELHGQLYDYMSDALEEIHTEYKLWALESAKEAIRDRET